MQINACLICASFKSSEFLECVASYVDVGETVHLGSWENGIIVCAAGRAEQSFPWNVWKVWMVVSSSGWPLLVWWDPLCACVCVFLCVCVRERVHAHAYVCSVCTPTLNWFLQKACRVLQTCDLCMVEPQYVWSCQRKRCMGKNKFSSKIHNYDHFFLNHCWVLVDAPSVIYATIP